MTLYLSTKRLFDDLGQGFSNFFVSRPFSKYFQFSATLGPYKLQGMYGKMTIQVDFGDP